MLIIINNLEKKFIMLTLFKQLSASFLFLSFIIMLFDKSNKLGLELLVVLPILFLPLQ